MNNETQKNMKGWSLFGLRVVVVAIFLYHGLPKALQWEMASEKFISMGFEIFWYEDW